MPYEPGDPVWEITKAMLRASGQDGDVLRAFLRFAGLLRTSDETMAQPGLLERIIELGGGWRDAEPMGPNRDQLLELVNA